MENNSFNVKTIHPAIRLPLARNRLSALQIAFFATFFSLFLLCPCLLAAPVDMLSVRNPSSSAGSDATIDDPLAPAVLAVVPLGERTLDSGHLPTAGQHRLLPVSSDLSPSPEAVRLVRIDVAATLSHVVFALSTPSSARVWLDFNGIPLAAFDASPTPTTFTADIPSALLVPHLPQRCRLHAEPNAPFVLSDFRLETPPPDSPATMPPLGPLPDLPWLSTLSELPPGAGAFPLDVRYSGGISLCGVSLLSSTPFPADDLGIPLPVYPIRLYFRFTGTNDVPPDLLLVLGYAQNGDIIPNDPVSLRAAVDANAFPFAGGRLVAADINLPVLPSLASGETFAIALDLQTASGRRLKGRTSDGSKIPPLFLPISVTIP